VTKLTRRSFLKQTSASAATLSLLPAIPALATISHSPEATMPLLPAESTGPIVVHVSNVGTGEITLLVGAREIVFHDPELVARLIKAAR
jgi:hypothetical protein